MGIPDLKGGLSSCALGLGPWPCYLQKLRGRQEDQIIKFGRTNDCWNLDSERWSLAGIRLKNLNKEEDRVVRSGFSKLIA